MPEDGPADRRSVAPPAAGALGADGLGSRKAPGLLRVLSIQRPCADQVVVRLMREDGAAFVLRAGQFCRIAVPVGDAVAWRSYTIATPPASDGVAEMFEIVASLMPGGLGSTYLLGLSAGDRVRAAGPFGDFGLGPTGPSHYLLVGTGTGVAPYRAMLPELERRAAASTAPLRVTLVLGVRSRDQALYRTAFTDFVAGAPATRRLWLCHSRALPERPQSHDVSGYVQRQLERLELCPTNDRVLLCGNPSMIDACFAQLIERGVDRSHIVSEKYVAGPAPRKPRSRRPAARR